MVLFWRVLHDTLKWGGVGIFSVIAFVALSAIGAAQVPEWKPSVLRQVAELSVMLSNPWCWVAMVAVVIAFVAAYVYSAHKIAEQQSLKGVAPTLSVHDSRKGFFNAVPNQGTQMYNETPPPSINMAMDSGWQERTDEWVRQFQPRFVSCTGLGKAKIVLSGGKITGVGYSASYTGPYLEISRGNDDSKFWIYLANVTAVSDMFVTAPEPFDLVLSIEV